ncbi:MAG TPA: hypothetical protein VME69_02335 [Methylocella sp.]|nr:hypothetical protein [Methylocella sp.]
MTNAAGERDKRTEAESLTEEAKRFILFRGGFEGVLIWSSLLTMLSFLVHVLFLIFADPAQWPSLSKESVYLTSAIPLSFGIIFAILAVYAFIRLRNRSLLHIGFLLLALSFGSLCLQGLLGIAMHHINRELETW